MKKKLSNKVKSVRPQKPGRRKQPKGFHDHNPPGTKFHRLTTRKDENTPRLGIPNPGGIVSEAFRNTRRLKDLSKLQD